MDKPKTDFYKRGKTGLQAKCKTCQNTNRKKYYKPHTSIRLALDISQEEVDEVLSIGQCQACGTTDRKLCIDHDHRTNKVRGLLCHNCNTALGLVGDNLSTLENLITYLKT